MTEESYVMRQLTVFKKDRKEAQLNIIKAPPAMCKALRGIPWQEGLSEWAVEASKSRAWSVLGKLTFSLDYRIYRNSVHRYGALTTICQDKEELDAHVKAFENIYDEKSEDKPPLEDAEYHRCLRGGTTKGFLSEMKLKGLPNKGNPDLPDELLVVFIKLENGFASCLPYSKHLKKDGLFPHAFTMAEDEILYDVMGVNGKVLASKLSLSEIAALFKIEYKKVAASAEANSEHKKSGEIVKGDIINKNLLILEHGTPLEETSMHKKQKEAKEKGKSYVYSEEKCMAKAGDIDQYLQDKDFEYVEAVIRRSREKLFNHKEETQ